MTTAVAEVGYLSTYLQVPETSISAVLAGPTVELVQAVLQAVALKAHEHEELQADKLRLEIELENAVRSSENRAQGLKASVEKALQDVNDLRAKLNSEEGTRSTLENELQQIKSSSTSSSAEVDSLKLRISSLEAANRDTVSVLEAKSTANDNLAQDLQKQHQKGLDLGQQISTLQQQLQNANSTLSSAKFRQQSLAQELEQAKRNNEWLDSELKSKSTEALKFRKEKGARIAELQRLNEDANATVEALKKTDSALRARLDEVQQKAEDSLSKIQQLHEGAATAEDGFRQELESSRRLADLRAQQTETHRSRLEEVEASLEKYKDNAAKEISRFQQALETEAQDREQCESRIAELEAEIDRLEAIVSQPQATQYAGSVPGTPRPSINGPGRSGSPFATPGSVRGRSSITATQALDELYKVKGQLANEKRRSEKLAQDMEKMMQGLEAKQPEIEELQAEHGRLQQEVVAMSKYVDQTAMEAERAKKDAKRAESEVATCRAESGILTQQLRDLSIQVKMLLVELDARERGLENLSVDERAQIERLARGEVGEGAFEGLTDTDRFISERLTVFRSINDLQEKNQELLRITRQLGAQMESEEALAAKSKALEDHEQVQVLLQRVESYKDELQNMVIRSDSYIKERDMFRRMLQHRGQLPGPADMGSMFARSVDGNAMANSVEGHSKEEAGSSLALRELQRHFDQYREEQSIDRRTLKEQTEKLASEKGALQSELAKATSQLTLAAERYEMLHANYTMVQNENNELQKRSQTLSESAAKQDLRTQQVAEDLIEARGLLESMRNETANLKAEKKLWKEIQDRLNQDNEDLMNERNRLNALVGSQQTMQNERELAENENRRRLQTQVETLEKELNVTKRKLNDEAEDNKKAQLRKEYDTQQNQKRIDDLASSLSHLKEELAVAKNTRDHLQARVDELHIELRSAEERVELLQPRPTPRAGAQAVGQNGQQAGTEAVVDREQELSIEVSELKRDLELAKGEVEATKAQMDQYKAISQASEEELQNFNDIQDQYRQEMDRLLEEKDTKVREIQQRIDDVSAELVSANEELNTLRSQQSEVARRVAEEKSELESEIARLRDEDEKHTIAAQFQKQDLRAQAEIATKAQQDYEQELVKHAAAAQAVQTIRADYNILKSESTALKTEAESAKVALSQSQASWEERRDQFERELSELRTRRDDVGAQNKLLLQQLESVGAQVTTLQQSRATAENNAETTSDTPPVADRSVDGLRELVTYLRRDKEIVDVQYELSIQEAKRLRQQLEYAQSQLDEARLKLDQERRSQADGSRSNLAHKDLMEKLNELNLFRESSITLRNEARQAQTHLSEKAQQVEELLAKIQPLETKVRELENAKEMQDGELLLLQEDRDRWQKRNQEILSKYDRIDPAEMEQLKQSVAALQSERDSLIADQQPLQEKVASFDAKEAAWNVTRGKIVDQAKERSRVLTKEKNDRIVERDTAVREKEAVEQQLTTLREELQSAIQNKEAVEQQLVEVQQQLEASQNKIAETESSPTAAANIVDSTQTQNLELSNELASIRKQLESLKAEKIEVDQRLENLQKELETTRQEHDQALQAAADASQAVQASEPANAALKSGAEEGQIVDSNENGLSDSERKTLEERTIAAEAKAAEAAEKARQVEESMENTIKQRSDKMKTQLNSKLTQLKEAAKTQLEEDFKQRLDQEKLKLEQEKQIWLAENKTIVAAPEVAKPVTSAPVAAANVPPATPGGTGPSSAPDFDITKMSLTDAQVREFLSSNNVVKGILQSNLKKKLEMETAKLKEEFERSTSEKLAEITKKAEESKENAVAMEGKKSALRINMSENKFKTANFKIQIVEKAATETPEKPVGEVWETAKNARPPPASSPQPAQHAAPQSAIPSSGSPATPANPAVKTETSEPISSQQPAAAQSLPKPAVAQQPQATATSNGAPAAPVITSQTNPTSLPAPPARTGIPIPRGGGIPRGRGGAYSAPRGNASGRGRGGGQGGRGGGNMNPGAQTFSPGAGNKRPHDDTNGSQGNGQKRIRGGGGGGA